MSQQQETKILSGTDKAQKRWQEAALIIETRKRLSEKQAWSNVIVLVLSAVSLVLLLSEGYLAPSGNILQSILLSAILVISFGRFLYGVFAEPGSDLAKARQFERQQIKNLFDEFIETLGSDQIPDELRDGWRPTRNPRTMVLRSKSSGVKYICQLQDESVYRFSVNVQKHLTDDEFDTTSLTRLVEDTNGFLQIPQSPVIGLKAAAEASEDEMSRWPPPAG